MILGTAAAGMGSGFRSLGNRAISIGGAGVASSRGSYAPYFNPALLTAHNYGVEFALSAGVGGREDNMADHLDTLSEIGIDESFNNLSSMEYPDISSVDPDSLLSGTGIVEDGVRRDLRAIQTELRAMSVRNGLELMPSGGVGLQMRNIGVGVYGLSDISATAVIDDDRLGLIYGVEQSGSQYYIEYDPETDTMTRRDQAYYEANSLEYAMETQTTTVMLTGVTYMEIPVAYARKFETSLGDLSVGGAFKIMSGSTYKLEKPVDTESGDISDDIEDYEEKDIAFGVDMGLLLNPMGLDSVALGLVVKNINGPEFDFCDGTTLEFKPLARAGFAYNVLLDRLTVALDVDLTKNESLIPGYDEQYVGGGLDFHPFSWFSIRGGMMKNMEESNEGAIYTAGLGLGAKWFQIDVAGQYSEEKGSYDGEDIPRYTRVQASIVSRWF
jgi:hypothetical protein